MADADKKPDWTKDFNFSPMPNDWPGARWAAQSLFQTALRGGPASRSCTEQGTLKGAYSLQTFLDTIEAYGGRMVESHYGSQNLNTPANAMYVWTDGMALYEYNWNKEVSLRVHTSNPELLKDLMGLCSLALEQKKSGTVSVITQGTSGLTLQNIGMAGVPFDEENYDGQVVKDFRHIIADFALTNPCGRISILDGAPGTGKTYMIRSMLSLAEGLRFIILPSDMVPSISGPQLLQLLCSTRSSDAASNQPLAMIIEDADSCLTTRGADNVSAISALLNMGDGILGAMLDLRIIATTNAGHINGASEIDPAISRSGRLCRRIHVGKLSAEQANTKYNRLLGQLGGPEMFTEATSLADVYRAARNGEAPKKKSNKVLGFGAK